MKLNITNKAAPSSLWPTPLELIDLQYAVRAGQERVTLSGREFKIHYEQEKSRVTPVDGFVPCGWFLYKEAFREIS